MTTLFFAAAVALLVAVLSAFLKESRLPVFSLLVTLAGGMVIILRLLPAFGQVIDIFRDLAVESGLNSVYLTLVLKIIAICYVAELVGQVCRDAGAGSMAVKLEIAAKVMIMMLATPVVITVMDSVLRLLP